MLYLHQDKTVVEFATPILLAKLDKDKSGKVLSNTKLTNPVLEVFTITIVVDIIIIVNTIARPLS